MTDARDIVERDHIKETTETLFRIAINATMPKENEAKWCQALQYAGAMLEKQQADLASLRKQLEDARSLPTDDGWEDIATAPRQVWLLCWGPDAGCGVAKYPFNIIGDEWPDYTHWRPLPAPPSE